MAFVGMSATCLLAFLSNTRLLRHSRTNHGLQLRHTSDVATQAAAGRCLDIQLVKAGIVVARSDSRYARTAYLSEKSARY